jgi:hypothetical protein
MENEAPPARQPGEPIRGLFELHYADEWPADPLVAHGLGVGAILTVCNGEQVNSVTNRPIGPNETTDSMREPNSGRRILLDFWEIENHERWADEIDALLTGMNTGRTIGCLGQAELEVRHRMAVGWGKPQIPATVWLAAMSAAMERVGVHPDFAAKSVELARRALRYEARMQADGLLPENGWVTSMLAYDYGRAVSVACWGLQAGFCEREEAEWVIRSASLAAQRDYVSWEHLAAGYILGRVMRFDGEEFGKFYFDSLDAHRSIFGDPRSPWRALEFAPVGDREGELPLLAGRPGTLVSDPAWPLKGPVARGMVCGAMHAAASGYAWNSLARSLEEARGWLEQAEAATFRHGFYIDGHAGWRQALHLLLAGVSLNPHIFALLRIRDAQAHGKARAVDFAAWRATALADDVAPADADEWAGKILAAEERLRADNALPRKAVVRSAIAADLARIPQHAAAGLAAGLCTRAEAETAVTGAALRARRFYRDWCEFSSAVLLIALLQGEPGLYERLLSGYRALDAAGLSSPWVQTMLYPLTMSYLS